MEDQERRPLQAKRQPEEDEDLFEDALDEEESEDELYGDELDEMDEEEEMDETSEVSKAESRPRKRVPKESPRISDAEEEIVNK